MAATKIDPAVEKIREIWARRRESGGTLHDLGVAMGYPETSAKQAAAQFLRGADPRLSTLRRFARAVGVSVASLVK